MLLTGMHGLGDNIYTRAFIPRDQVVYIKTPWPEIYEDLPLVRCVASGSPLRTQRKNEQQTAYKFHEAPAGNFKKVHYANVPIFQGLAGSIGTPAQQMSLPDFGPPPFAQKYAVIRPATVRKEWAAPARNPKPEYLAYCADQLKRAGYLVISVADLEPGHEVAAGPLPYADIQYHAGELHVKELLRLTQHADVIVGGVGWIVPAAIAQSRPAFIICGGEGGWNHPDVITHPSMDLTKITFIKPDNFCLCRSHQHDCDKTIKDFPSLFDSWILNLG